MSDWAAKRFWTDVSVVSDGAGFAVQLDARPVKTPAKAILQVPTRALAEEIAKEWAVIEGAVDPNVMPFTRSANAAIDKVSVQFDDVAAMLAAYGGSDLLCYRADHPEGLVTRQSVGWDPLLDWVHETFNARLVAAEGLMPIDQDQTALNAIAVPLFSATPFELTAVHDLVALSGSLVLALAVMRHKLTAIDAWALSRIDEVWQAEQWGDDEDATKAVKIKKAAFLHGAKFYEMAQSS